MRDVDVKYVKKEVEWLFSKIAYEYPTDVLGALKVAKDDEQTPVARQIMQMLLDNAHIAEQNRVPICQDTGMAFVFLKIGQEVHFTGGLLTEAIQEAVANAYQKEFLRASIVDDPLFRRENTKSNTPAVIYTEITSGDKIEMEAMAKGFGSENKSRIAMLNPSDGVEGVKKFVLETIQLAGANACPPMVVGVGVGGSFESSAYLAKKALLRPLSASNESEEYAQLEAELKQKANALNIGPMGLHGRTTVLQIAVESSPTHIAGLPVAVNICCHACRHQKVIL